MNRKYWGSALFLLVLAAATALILFRANDMKAVLAAIAAVRLLWLAPSVLAALLFVAGEGLIIWYLLRALHIPVQPPQCIRWSFIGFFFSAITPSATGGQPAQVYYMRREGVRIADSTPVLMVVAVLYKFVLVVLGVGLIAAAYKILRSAFGGLLWLYYLGLGLNVLLVGILVFVMVNPRCSRRIVTGLEAENANAESFASCMRVLAHDVLLRTRLGCAAKERAGALFTFRRFAEQTVRLIKEDINA